MLVKSNSQYDSFLFWRQPIPALDLSELEGLNLMDSIPTNSSQGKDEASQFTTKSKQDEVELAEYSSFNYWKTPLTNIDSLLADLNLLL